jgi:hypothetical protein
MSEHSHPEILVLGELAGTSNQTALGLEHSSASDRLTQSRERMRRVLQGDGPSDKPSELLSLHSPMLSIAQRAARYSLEVTADRHPLPLVGVAMAVGALLFWLRPWRLLLRPALIASVAAQITSRAIARVPIESVLDVVIARLASDPEKTQP